MSAVLSWAGDDDGLPTQALVHPSRSRARRSQPGELPPEIEQAIWRGCDLGAQDGNVVSSGFEALDAELPGGGWPCQSIAEVLSPQPSVLEWRVIGPALRAIVAAGRNVVVVGPPKTPHLPGLRHSGIDEKHLVWVRADTPAERLWCTEQLVKSGACGALVAWLPQARPEQIRRLQVCAQACEGPVFLFRPAAAQHEASAASLRVMAHDVMRSKEAGQGGEITIRTAEPSRNLEHLCRLLAEHLAKTELKAPVGELWLNATEVVSLDEKIASLLPDEAQQGESLQLVLERIAARLGPDRVLRPVLTEDHRLEWMQMWQPVPMPRPRKAAEPLNMPQPTWVLPTPLKLATRGHRPLYQGVLHLLTGPHRVEGGWWHRRGEGCDATTGHVQRDYWVALSEHAGVLWIYQERLASEETAWYLHGVFA